MVRGFSSPELQGRCPHETVEQDRDLGKGEVGGQGRILPTPSASNMFDARLHGGASGTRRWLLKQETAFECLGDSGRVPSREARLLGPPESGSGVPNGDNDALGLRVSVVKAPPTPNGRGVLASAVLKKAPLRGAAIAHEEPAGEA